MTGSSQRVEGGSSGSAAVPGSEYTGTQSAAQFDRHERTASTSFRVCCDAALSQGAQECVGNQECCTLQVKMRMKVRIVDNSETDLYMSERLSSLIGLILEAKATLILPPSLTASG